MTDDDIPSPIDLRDAATARRWADAADRTRPWRARIRSAIAELVCAAGARHILELGAGPGQLAEAILDGWAIERYTLYDFSPPMLDLARVRVGRHPAARFALGDFKQPGWATELEPVDAVVAMQSLHELRHERHLAPLYAALRPLTPLVVVADHEPGTPGLYATIEDQHAALRTAGFTPHTVLAIESMYVCAGRAG